LFGGESKEEENLFPRNKKEAITGKSGCKKKGMRYIYICARRKKMENKKVPWLTIVILSPVLLGILLAMSYRFLASFFSIQEEAGAYLYKGRFYDNLPKGKCFVFPQREGFEGLRKKDEDETERRFFRFSEGVVHKVGKPLLLLFLAPVAVVAANLLSIKILFSMAQNFFYFGHFGSGKISIGWGRFPLLKEQDVSMILLGTVIADLAIAIVF
jgi:hypothetical protein